MKRKNTSIGIIGGGFIGEVIKRFYPQAKVYDIRPGTWDSVEDVLAQDYIFVAVNFADNCLSYENRAVLSKYFDATPAGKVIVIKSTFAPGTTEYFVEKHPHLAFCYNPEFLTESTAWEDFVHPNFQILGITEQTREFVPALFSILPDAPMKKVIGAREAELLKHTINSYFAMKVIFFNQIYDASKVIGADYDVVREIIVKHPWVGDSHSIVWHKGYRGFGGKCLPKDVSALSKVVPLPLLRTLIEVNESLRSTELKQSSFPEVVVATRGYTDKNKIEAVPRQA